MSNVPFAGILSRHFKMNKDFVFDLVHDLLQSERELYTILSPPRVPPDTKVPKKIRRKLVEWIVQLCDELKLGYKTKQMTVIMVDLVLSKLKIHNNFLQLLGITCLFICVKCEESFLYSIANACEHSGNTYTKEEVSAMEMLILKALKWKLQYPTPGEIARRLIHISGASSFVEMPKLFKKIDNFIDLSLSENELSVYAPSSIAIASILCAFGSNQSLAQEWRQLMMTNGIFQFDFDSVDSLYYNMTQMLLKYQPDYFTPISPVPQQQELPQSLTTIHQEISQPSTTFTFTPESTIMTENYQTSLNNETYIEPIHEDVTLESLSQVGTPVHNIKKEIEDFRNSLLDTEKLFRESPRMLTEERAHGWTLSLGNMDEERSF